MAAIGTCVDRARRQDLQFRTSSLRAWFLVACGVVADPEGGLGRMSAASNLSKRGAKRLRRSPSLPCPWLEWFRGELAGWLDPAQQPALQSTALVRRLVRRPSLGRESLHTLALYLSVCVHGTAKLCNCYLQVYSIPTSEPNCWPTQ